MRRVAWRLAASHSGRDESVHPVGDVDAEDQAFRRVARCGRRIGLSGAAVREVLRSDERVVDLLGARVSPHVSAVRRVVERSEDGVAGRAGIDDLVAPAPRGRVLEVADRPVKHGSETLSGGVRDGTAEVARSEDERALELLRFDPSGGRQRQDGGDDRGEGESVLHEPFRRCSGGSVEPRNDGRCP